MSDEPSHAPALPEPLRLMQTFVRKYLGDESHLMPHVDFTLPDNKHVLMLAPPIGSRSEREKDQFNLFARAFIQAYDVQAFAMASEVWMAKVTTGSWDGTQPSQRLDREEGVMVFAATREGREYQWLAKVKREPEDDEDGRVVELVDLGIKSNDDVSSNPGFQGRWHDMFNPDSVPTGLVDAVRERMHKEVAP